MTTRLKAITTWIKTTTVFFLSCQRKENTGPLVEIGGGGGARGARGGGAIGKEQDEGNNTIRTRCCVGVGRAIY